MQAGQKVMLVDDAWPPGIHDLYDQIPLKDIPYVIRQVFIGTSMDALVMDLRREDGMGLLLVGVNNPLSAHKFGALERGFMARRFRLLDELRQVNQAVAEIQARVTTFEYLGVQFRIVDEPTRF